MEKSILTEWDKRMDNVVKKKAYAKINLGLDVLGVLPNGYHEVKMIMQTVGIYDELTFERANAGITITTDSGELPTNEDNLIYKACRLLMDRYDIHEGVKVHLQKQIPIAAGMAGGSADAAAALKGINELFGLGCEEEALKQIGVQIGADVPYCVMGGTALAEGIGEKLTPLTPPPDCYLLVAKPDINVSTKYVYEQLDALDSYEHPDIDGMVAALAAGDLGAMVKRMGNVLQEVTVPAYPIIETWKRRMLELGAVGSMMSGSGPTVFGIFTEEDKARNAYEKMAQETKVKQIFLTGFVKG